MSIPPYFSNASSKREYSVVRLALDALSSRHISRQSIGVRRTSSSLLLYPHQLYRVKFETLERNGRTDGRTLPRYQISHPRGVDACEGCAGTIQYCSRTSDTTRSRGQGRAMEYTTRVIATQADPITAIITGMTVDTLQKEDTPVFCS
jgi:hypothetical protein